jgi:hypothetical protein
VFSAGKICGGKEDYRRKICGGRKLCIHNRKMTENAQFPMKTAVKRE